MEIKITNPKIKEALALIIKRAGNEKRNLSPNPGKEPYWHHLVRVYHYLVESGEKNEDILLAAILHDSLEDGYIKREELSEKYNKNVNNIVLLLSEEEHTDHTVSSNRDYFFERILNYPDGKIRSAAMKIKVADRYDNLLGLSFTSYEDKKKQYLEEIDKYIMDFSKQTGMVNLMQNGVAILKGDKKAPDLTVSLI